jgi:nitronate monooxygenase
VRIPVVAAGGIADGRGVAAALTLGANAAVMGTAFLRCPEAKVHPAWANALANTTPEGTILSRAFSGKPGRSIATDYVRAAVGADAPAPALYPVQRGLTARMRLDAEKSGDVQRMQAWAGQSAALARAESASVVTERVWNEVEALLGKLKS